MGVLFPDLARPLHEHLHTPSALAQLQPGRRNTTAGDYNPLSYSEGGTRTRGGDPEAFAEALDRWVGYLEGLGVERVTWGALVLRRRRGRNWLTGIDIQPNWRP